MGAILVSCRNRGAAERDYVGALALAGWSGEVRLAGPGHGSPDPSSLLAGCSGLLLTGGRDIHPAHWDPGEPVHPAAEVDGDRDAFEIPLVRAAWAAAIPILGICRGEQILNVALGGSLVQDIPDHFGCPPGRHQHGNAEDPGAFHRVDLAPATRLAALLGPGPVPVNSRHHQAVRRIAPGLRIAATDPETTGAEGLLVEGIEADDPMRWVVGVQWHPENLVSRRDAPGDAARRLFAAFVRQAEDVAPAPFMATKY